MATPFFPPSQHTSGTYNFAPTNAEVIMLAFGRIQMRRTELEVSHIQDAVGELNLFLSAFNNAGPNLAQVDLQTIPLVQGTATYSVPAETVTLLDVFVRYGTPSTDVYLTQISRTEYAAIPNKSQQGLPTQLWFDRIASPTINLYLVPDGNGPYTLNYYRFRQVQDAQITGGQNPEVPNRAIDALVAGLAHRLSRIYRPEQEALRKADAMEAWALYAKQDTEFAPLQISPGVSGYWRI